MLIRFFQYINQNRINNIKKQAIKCMSAIFTRWKSLVRIQYRPLQPNPISAKLAAWGFFHGLLQFQIVTVDRKYSQMLTVGE